MTEIEFIEAGVSYLKNFDFINVTPQNILTDEVYSFHFKRFLSLQKGNTFETDSIINSIIKKIERKDNEH